LSGAYQKEMTPLDHQGAPRARRGSREASSSRWRILVWFLVKKMSVDTNK
jgi:hypothetical protein